MNRPILVKIFLSLCFATIFATGCKEEETVSEIQPWLQEKIEIYNGSCIYYGSRVTRYIWDTLYIYQIDIPIYSCYLCDVYYQNGDSVVFDSASLADYFDERTGAKVLWRYNNTDCVN
jgi:hypothetical protein